MITTSYTAPSLPARSLSFTTRFGWLIPILLCLVLVLAIFFSLCVGVYPMSVGYTAKLFLRLLNPFYSAAGPAWNFKELAVVKYIRPPRVLTATLAGLGLGLVGTALQGMLRNPLVGPDILGVNSGAAFGVALAITFSGAPITIFALAFAGGLLAMSSVFGVAKLARGGNNSIMLILSGVFVGAFFLALVGLVETYGNIYRLRQLLVGSFTNAGWPQVAIIGLPTLIGGAILMTLRWRLNLLTLGDLDAKSLGINVGALRWSVIVIVSIIVAAQVAVSGIISWIGFIIPHLARLLVGPDHRRLLPTAALLGALLTLGLDDLSRTSLYTGISINAFAAVVGTPIACFLLWKFRGRGWSRD